MFRSERESAVGRRAASAALLVALSSLGCAREEGPRDVLLVVVDTLRADHLECYGYERATAPAVARVAAEAELFENCIAPSSWTLPSMNMLLTGEVRVENSGEVHPEQRTLAERLRAHGLRTAAVVANPLLTGKRAEDSRAAESKGFERGFEHYELYDAAQAVGRVNSWPAREVTRRGLAWLEQLERQERAFLWLRYFDPHDPYEPAGGLRFEPWSSAERRAAFERALPIAERARLDASAYEGIEARIALYDSEIQQFDRAFSELRAGMERLGRWDETLLLLTADHGEGLWQRARLEGEADKPHAFFPELYFDHGVMLHQEQIHVPLLLRDPRGARGTRRMEFVSLLDCVPTVLERLGLREPGDASRLHGLDLGDAAALAARREVFSICSRSSSVILDGNYKLHLPREYRVQRYGARPEVFSLRDDPGERSALEDAALTNDLRARLEQWLARHARAAPVTPPSPGDPALFQRLGYFGEESGPQEERR